MDLNVCGQLSTANKRRLPTNKNKVEQTVQIERHLVSDHVQNNKHIQLNMITSVIEHGLHYYPNNCIVPIMTTSLLENSKTLCVVDCGCAANFFRVDKGAFFLALNSMDNLQYVASTRRVIQSFQRLGYAQVQRQMHSC